MEHQSVEAIQWWNLTDFRAWKGAPAGLLRKDMSPKPAYTALMYLIKKKWWTNCKATTSTQGECEFKGFLGDYVIRNVDETTSPNYASQLQATFALSQITKISK